MTLPSAPRYDAPSRLLHWVTAIAVIIAFVLGPEHFGRLIHSGVDPASRSDIVWHESLGALVFALTLVRLMWTAVRPAAPQIPMGAWMHTASKVAHLILWALLRLVPVTAVIALGSKARPLTLLGDFRYDDFSLIAQWSLAKLADWGDVHKVLADAMVWIAGLHAAGAIYHSVVLKDGVLASMLPIKGVR